MDAHDLRRLLERVREGRTSVEEGVEEIRGVAANLGFAEPDRFRGLRCGFPEVVFCEGKTPEEAARIATEILRSGSRLLCTRVSSDHARALIQAVPDAVHHEKARVVSVERHQVEKAGKVAVVSGGTADVPVAEEAAVTASCMGAEVDRLYDVGVAGLHRLLRQVDRLREASAIVVVAGMEGALPSVVGGLVDRPVVGVPTSVGYGASFGGVAALLAMLNSCAAGVTVVNIDNGFGAGYAAALINRLSAEGRGPRT